MFILTNIMIHSTNDHRNERRTELDNNNKDIVLFHKCEFCLEVI